MSSIVSAGSRSNCQRRTRRLRRRGKPLADDKYNSVTSQDPCPQSALGTEGTHFRGHQVVELIGVENLVGRVAFQRGNQRVFALLGGHPGLSPQGTGRKMISAFLCLRRGVGIDLEAGLQDPDCIFKRQPPSKESAGFMLIVTAKVLRPLRGCIEPIGKYFICPVLSLSFDP